MKPHTADTLVETLLAGDDFESYLAETKKKCPEPPEMWEHVLCDRPGLSQPREYCVGWLKALPEFGIADGKVKITPCSREEATHIELYSGALVWLGRVTCTGEMSSSKPESIERDKALYARNLPGRQNQRFTVDAR